MIRFGFDDAHHLCADEERIIGAAAVAQAGIGRPLSDGEIAPFLRTGALAVTEIFAVSFPANFAQLSVDRVASLLFRTRTLAGGLVRFLAAYVQRHGGRSLGGRFGGANELRLDGLILDDRHCRWLRSRHDKFVVGVAPVAVGFHEPFAEAVGHDETAFGSGPIEDVLAAYLAGTLKDNQIACDHHDCDHH